MYFEEKWTSKIYFGTKVDYVKQLELKAAYSRQTYPCFLFGIDICEV